jgi:site-specific recombinase XerD
MTETAHAESIEEETSGAILSALGGDAIATPADLDTLAGRARAYAEGARAAATRRAYKSDWRHYENWCAGAGLPALPASPGTIGLYLTAYADILTVSTLTRRLSAIAVAHRMAGCHLDTRHPAIRDMLRGVRRARGVAPRAAEALTVPLARRLVATCGDRLIDVRDRALILVGLGSALRRSELVAVDIADVTVSPEGLRIRVRRSKSDQEGEGRTIAIGRTGTATCPVAAYTAYIEAAGITEGAAWRSIDRHGRVGGRLPDRAVSEMVKSRAARAGLDPKGYSGHSLRAGLATSAAAVGIAEREIARVTGHKSMAVLRRYIREGEVWRRNVAAEIGL